MMAELVLYTNGSDDCIEAHRLLVAANVSHIVLVVKDQNWQAPSVKIGLTKNLVGLNVIRQYLQAEYDFVEGSAPQQPPNHPLHDDRMMASIAAITRQGGKI